MEKLQPILRFPKFDESWKKFKIGDLTSLTAGGTPSTSNAEYWGGDIPWMNSGELNLKRVYKVENRITEQGLKNSSTKLIPQFSILIGLAGQGKTRGTVAMNMFDLCTNQSIAAILPSKNYIPDFIYHNLDNRYDELRKLSTGDGGRGGLNLGILKALEINVPSLEEQTKVASFLTAVDDKLALLKKKKELLEQYKKGLMQKIFSQELRFKDDNGEDFPDWEEKRLGDLVIISMGQSPDSNSYNVDAIGLPLIQGNADIERRYTKPRQWTTAPTKICDIGDLVLTVRAPAGSVARSLHRACIGRGVCSLQVKRSNSISFIYQYLLHYEQKWVSLGQGSTFTAISGNDIKNLTISTPNQYEQGKIAAFLTSIDDKLKIVEHQIDHTKNYKKGLLQQMFI